MTMPSRSHRSLGPIGRSVVWIFTPHIDGRLKAHGVTFVSATQHFDTSDSTGMLMLNILLSFAQFERELTRERTMSKMAGRAERGLWNGGNVPLGYDYDKQTQILTPNAPEVTIAQSFFQRLIETRSPCTVVNEANARGYRSRVRVVKRRDGAEQRLGGKRFDEEDVRPSSATRSTRASSATVASSTRPGTSRSSMRRPGTRPTRRLTMVGRPTMASATGTTTSIG